MNRELELKLELSNEAMQRVRGHSAHKQLAVGQPTTNTLHSTYFDTLDRRLHEKGLSLRVRQVGEHWLQTVKAETQVRGGVSHPAEVEAPVAALKPDIAAISDKSIRKQVRKAVGKRPLVPLFETVVERTAQRVKAPEGAEVEIAFDKGVVRSEASTTDICEAELELKSGNPDALASVAETLFAGEPIHLCEASKAERGYRLADQRQQGKLEPLKASAPHLDAKQSAAAALREIFRAATEQILHNWTVVLENDDPEATHQMRIGLRRLRSALKVLRQVVDNESLRELNGKARDLGRLLGELRDADVLVTDIVGSAGAKRNDDPDLTALKKVLADSRANRQEKVRSELRGQQWSCLKLKFAMLPESVDRFSAEPQGKAKAKPIGALTGKALQNLWRRVAKSGRRLDKLSIPERHQMRKDVKTLRYATELLAPLYRVKDVNRFTNKLQRVQDAFGYLNDVALAEKLNLVRTNGTTGDPDLQRDVGYVIGWHTARAEHAWKDARTGWKRLAKSPPFWA